MADLNIFGENFSESNYEQSCKENGFTYWSARYLMQLLGYESWTSFQKAINKAMTTLNTLNIAIIGNMEQVYIVDPSTGKAIVDFKLSRLACYLVAMNADNKKVSVAQAQAYFASLAGAVQNYLEEASNVERINIRSEMSEREASLSGVVHQAKVENYAFFQNAGYRGMYNKNIAQLKKVRSIPDDRTLLDFMGKEELAANLFRITQTELKIKGDNISGQRPLENAAETVGKEVRATMVRISGIAPENLPVQEDIKETKKLIKRQGRELTKLDKAKKKKP